MATAAPQTAMDMPQEAAPNPFSDPKTIAVYDQMRQSVSPKEFGDEMLAGAAQTAPEDVAAFRSALEQIDLPPEALDLLNNMVDEILANPDKYEEIRAKYSEMGAPDEILPEQFDAEFFSALNMAVDQMIGEPAGVQAFAQGGIAELKPIAKAIASYGRNGDTMLAHITPAEARMLRRRGGSGTINPKTGLPEYFGLLKVISKSLKAIGKAVKSFAKSTVGKIVLTVALGYFLGPAAASMLSVSSVAGVAAVSGFVGGAGSTLLAGGNLKDSLKAGAIAGLTAGATVGISGAVSGTDAFASGSYTGPTTISGQVDKFTNMISPSVAPPSSIQPPTIDATGQARGLSPVPSVEPYPAIRPDEFGIDAQTYADSRAINNRPFVEAPPGQEQAFNNPEYAAKRVSLVPNAQGNLQVPAGQTVGQTTLPGGSVLTQNVPISAPYDPATATRAVDYGYTPGGAGNTAYKVPTIGESFSKMGEGLGMGDKAASFDTFKQGATDLFSPGPDNAQITARAREIMSTTPGSTLKDAMAAASTELSPGFMRTYGPATVAGLGAIGLAGGFTPSDATPSTLKPELMKPVTQRIAEGGNQKAFYVQNLPGVKYDEYGAPVFGQYNPLPTFDTGLGIASLAPRGVADGGYIGVGYAAGGVVTAEEKAAAEAKAAEAKAAAAALAIKQAADRKAVADAEAAEKAAGFGNAYKNINAGLSYDVPAGIAATSTAARQAAFKPTMDKFVQPKAAAAGTALPPATLTPAFALDLMYRSSTSGAPTSLFNQYGGYNAVKDIATKAGFQATPEWQDSYKASTNAATGAYTPTVVAQPYNNAKGYSNLMNMGGIASLRSGGYPRRTGQISGPGTATSDSIPAMLSDGEFVMTAKAVRGAGKGSRRAGAQKMYALMNQLEKNAARG